jgi:hypothetical protein
MGDLQAAHNTGLVSTLFVGCKTLDPFVKPAFHREKALKRALRVVALPRWFATLRRTPVYQGVLAGHAAVTKDMQDPVLKPSKI